MLRFLHISDTHISADPSYHLPETSGELAHPNRGAEALLEAIQRLPFSFEFILHTGDVCADPTAEDCRSARELLSRMPAPVYMLPGNHDSAAHMLDILHDGQSLNVLRDAALRFGDYHLITIDTCENGDVHAPVLGDDKIDWLDRRLAEVGQDTAIVALHHPLLETGVAWIDEQMRVQNGERVHNVLRRHSACIAAVIHGHIHQQAVTHCDGLLYLCCQSTWSNLAAYPNLGEPEADPHTPGGFNLVMLQNGRVFLRRFSLPTLIG